MEVKYTQEQMELMAKSYFEEIARLIELKTNKDLKIFDLNKKIKEQGLEIEKLKGQPQV